MPVRRFVNRVAPPIRLAERKLDAKIRRRGWRPAALGLWAVLSLAMAFEAHVRWFFSYDSDAVFVYRSTPEWVLVTLWFVAGVYAMRGAITRKSEHVADGYFALGFMPGFYGASYLWATIVSPIWSLIWQAIWAPNLLQAWQLFLMAMSTFDAFPGLFAVFVWAPISLIVYISATYERSRVGAVTEGDDIPAPR